jgi:hypothetical protein
MMRTDRAPIFLIVGIGLALALATIPFARYPSTVGADWYQYRDGIDRLMDGRPLYDPGLMLAPYNYLDPAYGGTFNMPPWFVPLTIPAAVLPRPFDRLFWMALIAAAVIAAVGLCLPRERRILVLGVLAVQTPLWVLLTWGNASAFVVLGIALWIIGSRINSTALLAAGLILSSIKLVPAIPLALALLRRRQVRPVVVAALGVIAITAVVAVVAGSNVLRDFYVVFGNIEQTHDANLAPSSVLAAVLPEPVATLLVRLLATALLAFLSLRPPSLLLIAAMEIVVMAYPLNVYSFWILHAGVLVLAAAALRGMDGTPRQPSTESHAIRVSTRRSSTSRAIRLPIGSVALAGSEGSLSSTS